MGKERTKRLAAYVRPETYEYLKKASEKEHLSISRYVARLIALDELSAKEFDVSKKLLAEERLRSIAELGKAEMTDIARYMEDLTARAGCYAVANWEFLKRMAKELDLNITDNHRREFLRKASKRLKEREARFLKDRKKFRFGD